MTDKIESFSFVLNSRRLGLRKIAVVLVVAVRGGETSLGVVPM